MPQPSPDNAGRNDLCPCGSGKKFKKCCMGKTVQATVAFQRSPQATAIMDQAVNALNNHNFNDAEILAGQVFAINSQDSEALHLIANAHLHRHEFEKAEETIRRCIALAPVNGAFYLTYGVILQEQGRIDEALAMNDKALSLNPVGFLQHIYNNIAICFYHKRELAKAVDYYDKAIAVDPGFAPAYFRRGIAFYEMHGAHSTQMSADFDRAAALDPNNAAMFQKMTVIYHDLRDYLKAIQLVRHAISIKPDLEGAWVQLANSYFKVGNVTTALSLYEHLKEKYPDNPTVKLEYACMFPAIAESTQDIAAWRERFMRGLDSLMAQNFTVRDPEWRLRNMPFYQGYHGLSNLPLMKKLAEFFLHSSPVLHYAAPHCAVPLRKKETIRIGFISEMFYSDLLSQFYGPLLDALAKDSRFEVVLMANSGRKSDSVDRLAATTMRYVSLPTHLAPAQQAVAKQEIDVLIYLDIGLNVMNYLLAFARLAPIQMVMGGHPLTTGIPNMDYFISSRAVEPGNAQEHYSEKLVLLEKNTVVFRRKQVPAGMKTREELGLPPDARLYACPVLLFKLHPDMDKVFASIMERDSQAIIILFDSAYKTLWRASLQKRFARTMPPELVARIHFLPYAPGDQFYYLARTMDCILDTFHFSFGTTAFLMLGADVPYVTLPGKFQRGRCGMLLYREMEMPELIAESPEHYVELALKLAQDKPFHERMVQTIRERSDRIFDDHSVVTPFVEMLWRYMSGGEPDNPRG